MGFHSFRSVLSYFTLSSVALGLVSGCGEAIKPPADTPIVTRIQKDVVSDSKPTVSPPVNNYPPVVSVPINNGKPVAISPINIGQAIEVTLTLTKSTILDREFIYNVDLQYSSQYDKDMDLYNQSAVIGNLPVVFRIKGNELQLVTDNKLKFPSDNNHPEDVIGRFRILSETETTLVVSGLNSAPYLATQMGPLDEDSKEVTYMDHWIRSFDFDPNGNYLLQQTSIKMSDGKTIAEFMESIYPRSNIAAGKLFQKFEMDPEDPIGASDGPAARFRFLTSDTIITHDMKGEKKLAFAEHFDISPKADGTPGTIDWYVTPNIPDDYIEPVKQAVEGWNRYFVKMKGIERPVVRFLGKLPAGIFIGDPRYNVINWDSRLIAGAAYESQAADPETGRQSHSVIYMPAAWFKIGADYWAKGIGSDSTVTETTPAPLGKSKGIRAFRNLKCARDLRDSANLLVSGRVLEDDLKNFGIQLLKQTLFHEVGHALGFAHNFKGSLSYDPSDAKSMFSTSIMDYNDFELERAAFADVNSADGPLLEYDRQTLSALYNNSQDIAESDAELPACNDAEADNEDGGVDPLCIRYDLQKDPTASILTAIRRVEDAQVDARDISLSQSLGRIADLSLSDVRVRAAQKEEDLKKLTQQFATTLKGSLDFYIVSDVAALARTARTNVKSLLEFGGDLPEGYDSQKMRETVFSGIQKIVSMTEIPATPKKALDDALNTGLDRLAATPYVQSLTEEKRTELISKLRKDLVAATATAYTKSETSGLPAGRARVLKTLARHNDVDFYLGKQGSAQVDYEANIVALLADVVSSKTRTSVERTGAASALATYKGRLSGSSAIKSISSALLEERATAASNDARRTIETIIKTLGLN
jgi:hypothetical protein